MDTQTTTFPMPDAEMNKLDAVRGDLPRTNLMRRSMGLMRSHPWPMVAVAGLVGGLLAFGFKKMR
jgi:hypothetical protein